MKIRKGIHRGVLFLFVFFSGKMMSSGLIITIYLILMSLFQNMTEELKAAMKSGDVLKRDTIRFVQSAVKNEAIELRKPASEMSDEEILTVIKRVAKQRRDSITQYQAAGRMDLVEKEQAELTLIEAYLPAQLPEAEVERIVREAIVETNAIAKSDLGRVMGVAMKKAAGQADGNSIRTIAERLLS
jgi:uncharacterized protein YqeY